MWCGAKQAPNLEVLRALRSGGPVVQQELQRSGFRRSYNVGMCGKAPRQMGKRECRTYLLISDHASSIVNHQLQIIHHQSSVTKHHSSIINPHHSASANNHSPTVKHNLYSVTYIP